MPSLAVPQSPTIAENGGERLRWRPGMLLTIGWKRRRLALCRTLAGAANKHGHAGGHGVNIAN